MKGRWAAACLAAALGPIPGLAGGSPAKTADARDAALDAAQGDAKNQDCLDCHEDSEDTVAFPDGSERSVGISVERWKASVHGARLTCVQCHRLIRDYPHPDRSAKSARGYRLTHADGCKRCHYAYYTRVLDGVHYALIEQGRADAPTCVDCHGAHEIQDPRAPGARIDRRCAACHDSVATVYAGSIHGRGGSDGRNPDLPTCNDCHGAHAIRDPRRADFRVSAHRMCEPCHADAGRMDKYGLTTNVLKSYLDDFHGASNALYASGKGGEASPMATCIDCHGSHGIRSMKRDGVAETRQRLQSVCARCHEDATPGFTDAWLSHYEPTLASAPLVWGVQWAYRILIPVMLFGLVLHVLLHLWRFGGRRGGSES